MKTILLVSLLVLSLSGCGLFQPRVEIREVKVPVPVPCKIIEPEKPVMPFQESDPDENIFVKMKKALAEIELRQGYEVKLEAAIKECNK